MTSLRSVFLEAIPPPFPSYRVSSHSVPGWGQFLTIKFNGGAPWNWLGLGQGLGIAKTHACSMPFSGTGCGVG